MVLHVLSAFDLRMLRGLSAIMLFLCGMVLSSFSHAASVKVILLTFSMCLSTLVTGGALCNHLDISNSISGVLCQRPDLWSLQHAWLCCCCCCCWFCRTAIGL